MWVPVVVLPNFMCQNLTRNDKDTQVNCDLVQLRCVTYNATTLKEKSHRAALERVLVENKVAVAGLQECRARVDHISELDHFKCFGAAGERGQFGCEVWLSKASQWDMRSIAVIKQEPRCMAVIGRCAGQMIAIVSAHAHQSSVDDCTIDGWWSSFATFLHGLPVSVLPIIFLDGNARFRFTAAGDRVAKNRNAENLRTCCGSWIAFP